MPRLTGTLDGKPVDLEPIPTADGDLHVTVVLERLTGADDRAMAAAIAAGAGEVSEQTKRHILKVLHSWDLLDDDDQPLPITMDSLDAVPARIVADIAVGVQEAMRPPPNGKPSAGGS